MPAPQRRRNAMLAFARVFKIGTPGVGRRLKAIPRMIKATVRGEYDAGLRLLLMAAASLYILSPLDAVPELILSVFGLIDDVFVITWLMGALLAETERFLEWEARERPTVLPGELVDR